MRALDQSLETALANGIATISLRGRYFTILDPKKIAAHASVKLGISLAAMRRGTRRASSCA
jgi:hypothetical protein